MRARSWMKQALWLTGASAVLLLASSDAGAAAPAAPRVDTCVQCHRALPAKLGAPAAAMANDIHAQKGLSCVNCHGGDPASFDIKIAKSKEKGYIGRPKPAQIPALCDKCHGDLAFMRRFNPSIAVDQFKAYQTSVHGKRLAQGDVKVATCASCHGAHGILPAAHANSSVYAPSVAKTCARCHSDKEYMKDYKIPTNQLENYLQSVHADLLINKRELSAPSCNDCHGNHGAFPPAVDSVSGMCGQCHVNNRDLFVKSPHKAAFEKMKVPECVVCHSNHKVVRVSEEMIGDTRPALCVMCHPPGSQPLKVAAGMRKRIEDLKGLIQRATSELDAAEHRGMEVSEAKFSMKEARTTLIKVRTQVHSLALKEVEKEAEGGTKIAKSALATALAAIEEFYARRRWVILPIILTVLMAGLLFLKLREVEGGPRGRT
ncbi:MAG: cytochrome c3 family protein [Candidatus Tectomicrobia bacterium]|uniref:Cytochrome c3 family protein n=1 Tax=Tectimicrobiota bacterium TaxID=2528274 RepID=A0A932HYF6_UNCTE|nr:cytochrome c3 family protein [Candidatus Tectomicrobia bacterium]